VNTPGRSGGGGYDNGSIFMLDNTTFGLEVCADHGMGRLRKATPLDGDIFVQSQLIPSGGMIIFPASVATCAMLTVRHRRPPTRTAMLPDSTASSIQC